MLKTYNLTSPETSSSCEVWCGPPHLGFACNGCGVRGDGLGDAKIDELELALHHQEIGRLQVAVHDARLVDRVHCLAALHMHTPESEFLPS